MLNQNRVTLMVVVAIIMFTQGCAKKDLVIDLGKGDAIRMVGAADNFDCSDPAYAGVENVPTTTMQFDDGSIKRLCAPAKSAAIRNTGSPIAAQGRKLIIVPHRAMPNEAFAGAAMPFPTSSQILPTASPCKQSRANDSNCDKQKSEDERRACRTSEFEKIDLALNERYQSLLLLLKGDSAGRLRKAENAWLQFRDATCALEAEDILTEKERRSASLREYTISECKGRITEQRIGEINFYLDALLKNPELHAIGVYEGPLHFGGKPVDDPSASTINVYVHVRGRPVVLALFNYESVVWNIIADEGVVIKEIVLSNYNGAKVAGLNDKAFKVSRQSFGASVYDDRTFSAVKTKLMEYSGLFVKSFQGEYKGKEFSIGP